MTYYTKVLLPDEQVRYLGRLHWAVYVPGWIYLLLALAAGVAYLGAGGQGGGAHGTGAAATAVSAVGVVLLAAAALFLVLGLYALLSAWGRRATTEIVVTDRRIIFKQGFIQRRTMEMNMNKVETVDVVQSIWGRVFNFGSVLVRGTGSTYEPLQRVADPVALRSAIIAQ